MSGDLLSRATAALRESTHEPDAAPDEVAMTRLSQALHARQPADGRASDAGGEHLLGRATHALRDATEIEPGPPDDLAIARLRNLLRDGLLTRATHALRESASDARRLDEERSDLLQTRAGGDEGARETAISKSALSHDRPAIHAQPRELAVERSLDDARRGDGLRIARGRRGRGRSRFARFVALPIAAVLVVMVGWASASGRLAHWIAIATHGEEERTERERTPPSAPSPKPATNPPRSLPALPSVASVDLPALPSAEPESSGTIPSIPLGGLRPPNPPTASAAPLRSAASTPSTAPSAPSPPSASPAKPAGPDPDALYRTAHEAHFAKRDPAAALVAWDRYLAAAPHGRFALEAKYNRAISLVRLGRNAEAAAALRPFANGDYGGYRKEEARELLQTLE